MFGTLIRRKDSTRRETSDVALETTIFSLTTDVPRPTDNRADERLLALLPVAKLTADGWQDLCRIRNISAGGLMADGTRQHEAGCRVVVELNSNQHIDGSLVWTRGATFGVKFNQNVDVREILANRKPRSGYRPRPARLDISCGAMIRIGGLYYRVEVRDISLGGIKIQVNDPKCVGKDAVVTVESLRPIAGKVRWYQDGMAGIVFDSPLTFAELSEWLGKRLELASMRSGAQTLARAS